MSVNDLVIDVGDRFGVEWRDDIECWAIRVENAVWVEDPRWLVWTMGGGVGDRAIDELITALSALRSKVGVQ